MPKIAGPLALAVALIAPIPSLAAAGGEKPAPAPTEINAQKRTVADIRNVGTALFSWLTDQVDTDSTPGEPVIGECTTPDTPAAPEAAAKEEKRMEADVRDIPEISWEELTRILVPEYLKEVPRTDGWGNPYEYRLNTANVYAHQVMAIRSGGADGFTSGDVYSIAGFDPGSLDEDLVWMDGFFVRWPERPKPAPRAEAPEKK
jgi:hypothetical protein